MNATHKNFFKCERCGTLVGFGNVVPATMFLTCKKCGARAWFVGGNEDSKNGNK